jgi:ArsR family transcriptional regulator, virulence genes transcriptional regulator
MANKGRSEAATLERDAAEVAGILRALANERRLMILCRLVEWGEANVNALADAVGLSQSALSQHLARMREEGLVAFRRESQTVWYRIADPRIERLFATLHDLFCRHQTAKPGSTAGKSNKKGNR